MIVIGVLVSHLLFPCILFQLYRVILVGLWKTSKSLCEGHRYLKLFNLCSHQYDL